MYSGCGLGLRREFINDIDSLETKPDWFEIVPENWIHTPNMYQKVFDNIAKDYPIVAHGVSLSIGSFDILNYDFLKELKAFLDRYDIKIYSEHLSFSSLEGLQSYELLPMPMNEESIQHIVNRVDEVQNYLQRELILENATYYYTPESDISEIEFINEVFKRSGAKMLLDINNIYVNSLNHDFKPYEFVDSLDLSQVIYYHVAGHSKFDDIYIDTHGSKVKDDVFDLLEYTLKNHKVPPMIERDNNIPPINILMKEYNRLKGIYENI
jgi:uncharacterized protein (UPF0276 family)